MSDILPFSFTQKPEILCTRDRPHVLPGFQSPVVPAAKHILSNYTGFPRQTAIYIFTRCLHNLVYLGEGYRSQVGRVNVGKLGF